MSMICCQNCGWFIDSDDDPDCFVGDRVLCERCCEEEEDEFEAAEKWKRLTRDGVGN